MRNKLSLSCVDSQLIILMIIQRVCGGFSHILCAHTQNVNIHIQTSVYRI